MTKTKNQSETLAKLKSSAVLQIPSLPVLFLRPTHPGVNNFMSVHHLLSFWSLWFTASLPLPTLICPQTWPQLGIQWYHCSSLNTRPSFRPLTNSDPQLDLLSSSFLYLPVASCYSPGTCFTLSSLNEVQNLPLCCAAFGSGNIPHYTSAEIFNIPFFFFLFFF